MVTMPPAWGTAPPDQVDGSDQFPLLTACCAKALPVKQVGTTNEKRNNRLFIRMDLDPPVLEIFATFKQDRIAQLASFEPISGRHGKMGH
jgi:hypothetical protein